MAAMGIRNPSVTCCCIGAKSGNDGSAVDALAAVRNECVALKDLLAPDDAWAAIVADGSTPNAARHRSYLLLAYERGFLDRVTLPMHHFLIKGQELHPTLTKQYRQDLPERWLLESDEIERHKRFRGFFGKIVELQVADWLTEVGWVVTELEALGHDCDIAAQSPAQLPYSVEVKFIGQGNDDFHLVFETLRGGRRVGSLPLYGAVNYMLLRIYEVAVSLRHNEGLKMAVIAVDGQTWPTLEVPLANGWVNWTNPAFLQTEEQDWNQFLELQRRTRYPAIDSDLPGLVQTLDKVWIVRLGNGFQCSLEHEPEVRRLTTG